MQTKYYGSIMVSKTMGVGSTPTVCDFMKGFTMGAECFEPLWKITETIMEFATWLMCTIGCFVAICVFLGAICAAIKEWIE